jgi:hypothetical protein
MLRRARWLAGVSAALCVPIASLGPAACGSSPHASRTRPASPVRAGGGTGGVSAHILERALVTRGGHPAPTSATCRGATPAERSKAPFGRTRRPVFTCLLTLTGERARYAVQVLANGCYVAERRRPGRAVYGCGADGV